MGGFDQTSQTPGTTNTTPSTGGISTQGGSTVPAIQVDPHALHHASRLLGTYASEVQALAAQFLSDGSRIEHDLGLPAAMAAGRQTGRELLSILRVLEQTHADVASLFHETATGYVKADTQVSSIVGTSGASG